MIGGCGPRVVHKVGLLHHFIGGEDIAPPLFQMVDVQGSMSVESVHQLAA